VILDVARDAVENHPEKDAIELDEDEKGKSIADVIGETKDKAVRLVTAHHAEIAPVIQPTHVARKFSMNMDRWLRLEAKRIHVKADTLADDWSRRIMHRQASYLNVAAKEGFDFVGEMDIVEPGVIRDTKTSKKSPSENTAHESHQLSAYALASQVLDGKLPEKLKLDYLIDLKRETKTLTLETVRDSADMVAFLDRLVRGIVSIRSGAFVPAPDTAWWCSEKWCAYHSICPAVKRKVSTIGGK